jgi:predicted TIM-barrel fold metal-dependent hydrolase
LYGNVKVLDVHAHVSVPAASTMFLTGMLGANTPLPSPLSQERPFFIPPIPEDEYRAAAARHVEYIDARNIDVQVIGPRPFMMFGWMQPHLLPAWTRYVNDMIHQQCAFYPDRFLGACQLPQDPHARDTRHCLPELDRCVRDYGFVAAYVSPDPDGRRTAPGMHDEYWFPLYARCAELGIPIIVHGSNSLDPRYRHVPHNYQLGFVTEQYLARRILQHSDVFDRFPTLKIVICHCGGALDRFIAEDADHLAGRDLSANLFVDSCGYERNFLEAAIRQRGVSSVCFGTEAPGSGRTVRPETGLTADDLVPVIAGFDWLSEEEKVRIFNLNPAVVCPALAKA